MDRVFVLVKGFVENLDEVRARKGFEKTLGELLYFARKYNNEKLEGLIYDVADKAGVSVEAVPAENPPSLKDVIYYVVEFPDAIREINTLALWIHGRGVEQ